MHMGWVTRCGMGGAVMHGEQGTRDVAGQSASKNTWAMLWPVCWSSWDIKAFIPTEKGEKEKLLNSIWTTC
jgi:hypothetical protein